MTEPSDALEALNPDDAHKATGAPAHHDDRATPTRRGFRGFFSELRDDLTRNNPGPEITVADVGFLILLCALLTIFFYWGRPQYFRFSLWNETAELIGMARTHEYYGLLPYGYWAIMSVLMRMVLPALIIALVMKDSVRDYGYRLKGEAAHARIYLFLYAFMFPIVVAVSFTTSFQQKYPFYGGSVNGLDHFAIYQLCYGIQFFGLEAFFRGFVLFALFKRFGYYAIPIMTVPYCMIHFGKPPLETFGSVFAGLALGYLALKSKSWVHGALLHWSIGITMDLLAIFHRGGFK